MKRCLCLLEFDIPTGFATVSKNLINQFVKKMPNVYFDIVSIDYGYNYTYHERINIIGVDNDKFNDSFGRGVFMDLLVANDYDYIFIVNDITVGLDFAPLLNKVKKDKKAANKKQFKSFFYFPIDAEYKGLPHLFNAKEYDLETLESEDKEFIEKYNIGLEFYDQLATYTKFGREVIYRNNPKLKGKIQIIPHGTETNVFKPLNEIERQSFRKKLFGENINKFIFLNLNRNQPRKDLFSTIMAFEDAVLNWNHETKPYLYIHSALIHKDSFDLIKIFNQTSLKQNVHYQILDDKHSIWGGEMPNSEMVNKVYNSCDIGITTATGGGWELFITESYATKLPLIVPNHTSFKELSHNEKYSKLLKNIYPCCNQFDSIIREQVDIYELSELMVDAPKKMHDYKNRANDAFEFVTKKLTWDIVSNSFLEWFKN